jgi:allantoinase
MTLERDFVGYGMNPPRVRWPNNARIAVQVAVNYEEGAEYSLLDGDPHREPSGDMASPIPLGERDLLNESWFEYGSRVGIWRILGLLDKYNIRASVLACGLALERNPEVGREIVKRGHEVMGHGYRWVEHHKMSRDEERASIVKCVEALKRITGERPVGWMPRYGPSLNTRELLVEEGGFVYDSCYALNDDLPYFVDVRGKRWLVMPYSNDVNDGRAFRGGGGLTDFYNAMRNAFDTLYEEGATHPKVMTVSLHCRVSGRPAAARVVNDFLAYATKCPDVWFARRIDIARWWMAHEPSLRVTT